QPGSSLSPYTTLFRSELSDNSIIFEAKVPIPPHGATYENIDEIESLKVEFQDLLNISRYKNPNPYMKRFNLDWIKLEEKTSPLEDRKSTRLNSSHVKI